MWKYRSAASILTRGVRRTMLPAVTTASAIHSTTNTTTIRPLSSTRRRRRGGGGGFKPAAAATVNQPLNFVTDTLEFVLAAQDFLDKIQDALEPMKKHNPVFIIQRDATRLTLTLQDTQEYSLEIVEEEHSVAFQSPISGKFLYVLSSSTKEWVNRDDGHLMEGLLVRDLIRQCNGLPEL